QDLIASAIQNGFVARATQEASYDGAILGCAVRKFVVHEGGGEHAPPFAARNQESKAGRQRAADSLVVTESNRHGRTVTNLAKLGCQLLVRHLQDGGSSGGGGGHDERVEVIALIAGGNGPPVVLGDDGLDRR